MDEFNNKNINNEQDNYYTVYDATDYEYEIKLNKMRRKNRIISFICIVIVAVTLLSVSVIITADRHKNNVIIYNDTDYGIFTNTDTDTVVGDHYAPVFTDYNTDTTLIQSTNQGKTALNPTQIYEKCANTTVTVYSYSGNQIKNPTGFATGTIITNDGYIVTNEHVVNGFTNFTVTTFDGKEYEASLVGSDEKTDLAVIKIEANNLTPAEFGYVSDMQIGETIYAIGNPSGLTASLTTGIVSSLSRTISTLDPYTISHLQIDAPVNTGNSGGELINQYGQVVGIVDAKFVSNYAEGIGFAISIDEAIPIIQDIIANGKVTGRVKLGITYTAITEEKAKLTDDIAGLHITAISDTLPVSKSGLKIGDVVTDINSFDVSQQDEFRKAIRQMKIGDTITMTVNRNGEVFTIKTTVGAYDE